MSQIIATTLSNGSVSVPTATVVNGSAKAWVNFNGTGTIAARDSLNLSSLTDNGAGNYTVNFSSAFSAGNYHVGCNTGTNTGANQAIVANPLSSAAIQASSCQIYVLLAVNGAFDRDPVTGVFHGDLA